MTRMKVSAVREILKVAERPDILSFAGGLPAPELFPVEAIARAHAETLARSGEQALQYSVTEGYAPLRAWISDRLARRGTTVGVDNILVTTGSQQGIDLVAKVLLDPGDVVAVENPSYLAALQVFSGYEASFEVVGSDDAGMRVDELEALIARRKPKLIYIVADFHNPKGTTLSLERRLALVKLAAKHQIPILEDDPYGELRFRGERLPSLMALDEAGVVVQLGTFSKTLAPGMRIGWLAGSTQLVRACTTAKQAADLHSATLAQRAAATLLETFDYDAHVEKIRAVYGERCLTMLGALEKHLPPGSRWTRPDGGLFVWVRLPSGLRAEELLVPAVEQKVAFVPGSPFFAAEPERETLRLNFSNRPSELIELGMERLGRVVRAAMPDSARVHAAQ
ncbi:MAG: PLP-dependent aminotransferase family protein [Deltaproteobacteria bacterium]|nr:PLP-dependent aminotransferase family protein [Deltaproteobacteria bacterium]